MTKTGRVDPNPLVIVISGPSGVGKDVVLKGMRKLGHSIYFAVTATTRAKRRGETDGEDYSFISRDEFKKMIADNELLEWANVYGNLYGVPRKQVREALDRGEDVVVKVDVQGAETIKRKVPEAVLIFVAPPSLGELEERLRQRKTESGVDLQLRVGAAHEEMNSLAEFDYVVVNHEGRVAQAVSEIESIIAAEKCRTRARSVEI